MASNSALHRKPVPMDSPTVDHRSPTSATSIPARFGSPDTPTLPEIAPFEPFENDNAPKVPKNNAMKLHKHNLPPPLPPKNPPVPPKNVERPSTSSARLTKEQPTIYHNRSSSLQNNKEPQGALKPRGSSPAPKGRSTSAQPPATRFGPAEGPRIVSAPLDASPTPKQSSDSPVDGEKRGRLRRSWFPGSKSRSGSKDLKNKSNAWIIGQGDTDYNTSFLTNGEKVPELWNESGNVYVFLFSKESGRGPSFKVPWFAIDSSVGFNQLIEAEDSTTPASSRARTFDGRDTLGISDAQRPDRSDSPPLSDSDVRLYLPVTAANNGQTNLPPPNAAAGPEADRLIAIRNLFAFLTGQPLVGTKAAPNIFTVFMKISGLLQEFGFTNADGSTYGDAVNMSFNFFTEQMAFRDVRHSREKTLESLVLGERMRSWELYNEAFSHAVGKYTAIRDLNSPLWGQVTPNTRQRLERAHLDLLSRQDSVNNRLEAFEFPSLFSGVANSTSLTEYKNVRFKLWQRSFNRMKQFVLNYYKTSFGNWPPKARSKKNPFSESGLNRLVLKILYSDLCALYDLTVDRDNITPRVIDGMTEDFDDENDPHMAALRRIFGEFDRSSPPVLPPIPFDIPKIPDMKTIKENYYNLPAREQVRLDKTLQENEMLLILNKAYDFDTWKLKVPFLAEFKEFEYKEAKGKTVADMADQRIGYWLFLYVVIQSLPMLVVDAPGLQFTEGVEYFLCEPPKGYPPWLEDVGEVRKVWYQVAGGGYVELSADAVEFSIEGTYHRSHCWLAAKTWSDPAASAPQPTEEAMSPLPPPQAVFADMDPGAGSPRNLSPKGSPSLSPQVALRPRSRSPAASAAARSSYRSSMMMGLEPLAMPGEAGLPGGERRGSRVASAMVPPGSAGGLGTPVSAGGSRPGSSHINKSMSHGNLRAMATASPATPASNGEEKPRQASVGGSSTFDDILKDMDNKPKKKKTFFGGGS